MNNVSRGRPWGIQCSSCSTAIYWCNAVTHLQIHTHYRVGSPFSVQHTQPSSPRRDSNSDSNSELRALHQYHPSISGLHGPHLLRRNTCFAHLWNVYYRACQTDSGWSWGSGSPSPCLAKSQKSVSWQATQTAASLPGAHSVWQRKG